MTAGKRSDRWRRLGRWATQGVVLLLAWSSQYFLWDTHERMETWAYFSGIGSYEMPGLVAVVLVAAQTLPVLWRRRWPWAVLAVSLTATLLLERRGYPRWAGAMCPPFVVFTLAVGERWYRSGLAAVATGLVLWVALRHEPNISGGTGLAIFLAVVPWLLGMAVRWRRERVGLALP